MKRLLSVAVLALLSLSAWAQPLQEKVAALSSKGPLGSSVVGISVRDASGKEIVSLGSGRKMVPGSNMKLITTASALHSLGQDWRFKTGIGIVGTVTDGRLDGDVYIIGGGDPAIGVKDSIALRPDALFWKWKSILREAGITSINGRVVGDGRLWEGPLEDAGWNYDDIGTYYGTGSSALSFYANTIDFQVSAGAPGSPVIIRQLYPSTPWLEVLNRTVTGPAGTGNSLYLFTTDISPRAEMRGTFATDRRPKTEHFSNKYGALTCALEFVENLRRTGWEVTGGACDIDPTGRLRNTSFSILEAAAPSGSIRILGTVDSPSLSLIARETNHRSDNFYAESMFRAMGETASGISVYDSCRVAALEVVEAVIGRPVRTEELRQRDGSGLSRMDYVTPAFMSLFLKSMESSPAFGAFLHSLPNPGSEGTVKTLLRKASPADRSRIFLKSGSMDGILCYSGYVFPAGTGAGAGADAAGSAGIGTGTGAGATVGADGPVTFSIMVNNATVDTPVLRAALEEILLLLL